VTRCRTGQKVCPGLTTLPQTSRSWGQGIYGEQDCTHCCHFCADKQVNLEAQCKGSSSILIRSLDDGLGASGEDGELTSVDSE
jgi:hypothetical protein